MIVDQIDALVGEKTGVKPQAVFFAFAGVVEAGVYVALLPLLHALAQSDGASALRWALIVVAFGIVSAAVSFVAENRGYFIGTKRVVSRIQERLGDHVVSLPLGWFTAARAGQLSSLLERDLQMVMNFPGVFLRQLVSSVTVPACIALLFLYIDWRIFLSFIALAPLLYAGAKRRRNRMPGSPPVLSSSFRLSPFCGRRDRRTKAGRRLRRISNAIARRPWPRSI